ncbi:MAG TPA: phospholipase D family protein, partial [Usitatibacter sp.]|nr:phospholipase D family protein [Usitatibacter sp.]
DAAARGVRVRLLVDDMTLDDKDALFERLDAHANIEVRRFNPFRTSRPSLPSKVAQFLVEGPRLNRRMHNKSFIVDNRAAVIGGRNIGNEYFGAGTEVPFKDLDVIAIGHAVGDISAQFDLYWNSASAYPAALIVPAGEADVPAMRARFKDARDDPVSVTYLRAVADTPLVQDLLERRLPFEWADAVVVRDDPSKTLDSAPERGSLALAQMLDVAGPPVASFDLISPYFVPGEKGTQALEQLARRGVRVRVLTNSLAGTDVAVVHSGYAKRRCALARAGVTLYELKPSVADLAGNKRKAASDSSAARLHAKTFALDRDRVFVGSFNFDLRSALLNTELGLIIHSPPLAERLSRTFDGLVVENSYEVRPVAGEPCIEWVERTAGTETVYATEPHTSGWSRFWLSVFMALPIDWML